MTALGQTCTTRTNPPATSAASSCCWIYRHQFAKRHQQPGSWWGSYGAFDFNQVARESARHGVANPLVLPHQNIKKAFAKARKIKQVGMATALQIAGLTPEGRHHRALDDALNIARLLAFCPRPDSAAEG